MDSEVVKEIPQLKPQSPTHDAPIDVEKPLALDTANKQRLHQARAPRASHGLHGSKHGSSHGLPQHPLCERPYITGGALAVVFWTLCLVYATQEHAVDETLVDAEIDKWCMDFLNLHDLTDHKTQFAIQSKLGKLAGLAYQAISSERLRPMAKFLCWLFLADDFMEDSSVPVSDLKNATLAYKLIFKNNYDQAITLVESKDLLRQMGMLNDVYTDLKGFMKPGHKTRFSNSMIDVLDMFEVESTWLHKKLVPNFEIYMWMRDVTAGVIPCMVAIDFLNNFGLEDEVLEHPNIQRLEVIANRHTYLANDMLSFKKEWACDMYLNSVALVGYSSNCGLNEAMEKVAEMVQDLEKEFADTKQKVLSNKDLNKGNVMGYVQGLEYFMAGNLEFAWLSARYHGVGWVSPAEKYGTFEF
ncbi:microbial Terpene synthase-like protein 1 [Selaginella moellendorffii]|uniref:microbial Terpene synthase-like protein 1 n=1 Tax=Selaginella moellendorffii TaxID=88036 RepID=UPI000D1CAA30|nr:microbial Terpene synthase-like protein 1 [Selaginella moellendorffii]|eukprot:XP_024521032.1 microbial Terpene synthase-like protein 1 [Selaginella moellendorffii]